MKLYIALNYRIFLQRDMKEKTEWLNVLKTKAAVSAGTSTPAVLPHPSSTRWCGNCQLPTGANAGLSSRLPKKKKSRLLASLRHALQEVLVKDPFVSLKLQYRCGECWGVCGLGGFFLSESHHFSHAHCFTAIERRQHSIFDEPR